MSDQDPTKAAIDSSRRVASAGTEALRVGVDSATEIAEIGFSVVEELMAGFDTVARRGSNAVVASVDKAKDAAARVTGGDDRRRSTDDGRPSTDDGRPSADDADREQPSRQTADDVGELIGQALDLAQHALRVATDAAARVLEVGIGPVEQLVDPKGHRRADDARIDLGNVQPGRRVSGEFELTSTADHDIEVTLGLINPLAGMRGTIGIDQVTLDPLRVTVPAHGERSVQVTVDVPASTPAGRYLGIVRADSVPDLAVVVSIDVA
jgi:hypothetical protein